MSAPSVVFCSMQNSGGSAIDPILKELLSGKGYFVPTYGPEGTADNLRAELASGKIRAPFYHWTHDPMATFEGLVGRDDYRFIYMHRDPRDVAVSWAHDYQNRGQTEGFTYRQVLERVVTVILPPHVKEAIEWINAGCRVITFTQMKEDMPSLIRALLDYVGDVETDEEAIAEVIDKHSFERITGRRRGEEGAAIRTQGAFRKGISGEWKKHFDDDLIRKYKRAFGLELRALGYPPG